MNIYKKKIKKNGLPKGKYYGVAYTAVIHGWIAFFDGSLTFPLYTGYYILFKISYRVHVDGIIWGVSYKIYSWWRSITMQYYKFVSSKIYIYMFANIVRRRSFRYTIFLANVSNVNIVIINYYSEANNRTLLRV